LGIKKRSIRGHEEVKTGKRDEVHCKLPQIAVKRERISSNLRVRRRDEPVELSRESKTSTDAAHNFGYYL
jgi:hypothetical protein